MRKKLQMIALAGLLIFNSTGAMGPVFAHEPVVQTVTSQSDTKTCDIVYVQDGEGQEGEGNGTVNSPFQNLRTALEQIQDGQTLRLIGTVKYTKYELHKDGSALPLLFDKNITVEGDYGSSSLVLRTKIQLGADVTFRNMRLQMVPEIILGDSNQNSQSKIVGQEADKSTTIFLAGYSLTLDRVNTKMGESLDQYATRPYISGGSYKGTGEAGKKASLTILNPTDETRIAAIYAGDYWFDREMDVELNLAGKLLDTTIYTGGDGVELKGDVTVNLTGFSNLTDFNRLHHTGKLNLTLEKNVFSASLSVEGVENLVLQEGARITVTDGGSFQVKHVTLGKKAVLDFRYMNQSPLVGGTFTGTAINSDPQSCGAVLLNNDQTLQVEDEVTGLTRLNTNGLESVAMFREGHVYVTAKPESSGTFTIDGTTYTHFELKKITEGKAVWKIERAFVEEHLRFQSFHFSGGADKIIEPQKGDEYYFPVEFVNRSGQVYKPGSYELYTDFDFLLERADGEPIDMDQDVFTDWDEYYFGDDVDAPNQIVCIVYKPENAYGELILSVKHLESGTSIEKRIMVVEKEGETPSEKPSEKPSVTPSEKPSVEPGVQPSEKPDVEPSVQPSEKPSVEPSVQPSEKPSVTPGVTPDITPVVSPSASPVVKPKITLSKSSLTLYTTGTKTAKLTAKVTGTSKKVSYKSSNTAVATVDQSGNITAKKAGKAVITASVNGVTATCNVTVKATSLTLDKKTATIYTAGVTKVQLKAKTSGASSKVKFTTSNSKVARVDQSGRVTAVSSGTATISASANGLTRTCKITVKKPVLTVGKTKVTVKKGKKLKLNVKATPAKTISYSSNNKKLATVDKNGVVTGVKPGTAIIIIKCNGITKRVSVTVKK